MKTQIRSLLLLVRSMTCGALLAATLVSPAHALVHGDSLPLSGTTHASFSDVYDFTLDAASVLDYATGRSNLPTHSYASFSAILYSGTTPLISGVDKPPIMAFGIPVIPNTFTSGILSPGAYHLDITGAASGTLITAYLGHLNVLAPVPEPEVWAMMLVGMALVGMRASRSRRVASGGPAVA